MKKYNLLFCLLLFWGNGHAQFLVDKESQKVVKEALDQIYNHEFSEAEHGLEPIFIKYKNHAVSHLLKALLLYWKYKPVAQNAAQAKNYIAELEECIRLGETLLKSGKYKPEATFYLLSAHGFISKFHHFNKDYFKAAFEAKSAYGYLKDGFGFAAENPDFLFTTGLYQYYRVEYPESHPVVKPIIYFFKEGNKASGLDNLRKASKLALFSKVEAADYLGSICLKYESRNSEALSNYLNLHRQYPNNPDFLLKYIECLVANNRYIEAERENKKLQKYPQTDFKLAYLTYNGQIELSKGQEAKAKYFLIEALKIAGNGYHTDELRAMVNLSLGKLYMQENQNTEARKYLNSCLEIAEYKSVISEAKELLKML